MSEAVRVGVIGGGLMGREVASAFGRWFAITESEVKPQLVGVADLNPEALKWFEAVPGCDLLTQDYTELLADESVDVVYVAVPHNLHEKIYLEVLAAGKDLMPKGFSASRSLPAASTSR